MIRKRAFAMSTEPSISFVLPLDDTSATLRRAQYTFFSFPVAFLPPLLSPYRTLLANAIDGAIVQGTGCHIAWTARAHRLNTPPGPYHTTNRPAKPSYGRGDPCGRPLAPT